MTIKEIAKLAGVSSAAVSRYMNGGYISDEKKAQIQKVIKETGYRPSIQARMLRTKKACLIGVIVPKINSESVSRVTAGIGQVLAARGYQMLLAITDNNPAKELEYADLFESYPVDGIILIGTVITPKHKKMFKNIKVPVVVIGQQVREVSCIYHDDYSAAREMAVYAAEQSAKEIGYIGVLKEDKAAGAARLDGFSDGLKACGRQLREDCFAQADFTTESGYACARKLLKSENDIGIICCATDTIASGALRAVSEYEKEGGAPVEVTGFGDNHILKAVSGGITTVHFAYMTSGIKGAELLLDMVEDKDSVAVQIKLGHTFVKKGGEAALSE